MMCREELMRVVCELAELKAGYYADKNGIETQRLDPDERPEDEVYINTEEYQDIFNTFYDEIETEVYGLMEKNPNMNLKEIEGLYLRG